MLEHKLFRSVCNPAGSSERTFLKSVCVLFQDAVALERGGWCCPADEDDLEAPVRSELSCVNADCDQSERYA